MKVSVLGATGYAGAELLRILYQHPQADVVHITSESHTGESIASLYPHLRGLYDMKLESMQDIRAIGEDSDFIFIGLPHGHAMEVARALADLPVRIIDLGADFRFDDTAVYEAWYHVKHTYADAPRVYGLAELYRDAVRSAKIIGNVGCALAPSYAWLMVARVVTSFCHAAFFGIGAVVAASVSSGRGGARYGRTGIIHTPHGDIHTPAFVPVATQAAMKAVLPETMKDLGAQCLLSNAFHLYERPGEQVLDEAGGLAKFMNWNGPTFTDSGGFQVLSLGAGFKKTLAMDVTGMKSDDVIAEGKERLAFVDEDGVTFKSPLNGSLHRFSAEISMGIQHKIGADIMFAFDELTTLMNTRGYQERSVERTYR